MMMPLESETASSVRCGSKESQVPRPVDSLHAPRVHDG